MIIYFRKSTQYCCLRFLNVPTIPHIVTTPMLWSETERSLEVGNSRKMSPALGWFPAWEIIVCDCWEYSSPLYPPGNASWSGKNHCIIVSSDQWILRTSFRTWCWFKWGAYQHWKRPPRRPNTVPALEPLMRLPVNQVSKHQQFRVGNLASNPECLLKHHTCYLPHLIWSNELSKKALWKYPREYCLIHKLRESEDERFKIPLRIPWVTHLPPFF